MATVHVVLAAVTARSTTAVALPVYNSAPVDVATVAPTESSAAVTGVQGTLGLVWNLTVEGGPVWVAFGAAPVAGSGGGWLLPEGRHDFAVTSPGELVAIKSAA